MNHYGIDSPGPLFAQRAPSVHGSVTSAAAADSLDGATLNAMQAKVLRFLETCLGGATDEEMQLAKTSSGRMACVWRKA